MVTIGETDSLERALKAFKRKVQASGVLKDWRKGRWYAKPSLAKRLKHRAAIQRLQRELRKRKPRRKQRVAQEALNERAAA